MDSNAIVQRYNNLKSLRDGYWLSVWREVRQYVMPTYSDYLTEGVLNYCNILRPRRIVIGGGLSYVPEIINIVKNKCHKKVIKL